MRFFFRQRLRRTKDFELMREEGRRVNCGPFIYIYRKRKAEEEAFGRRFGVIASKKVGKAVKRNRGKRVFREIFRLNQEKLPEECDILVVVRSDFDNYGFSELQERFNKASKAIGGEE